MFSSSSLLAAEQIFYDDFHGGNLSDHDWVSEDEYLNGEVVKWDILNDGSRSPQPWCAGQNSGGATPWENYANNMITTLKKDGIDLFGYKNCNLRFQYALQVHDFGDYLEVRVNDAFKRRYEINHDWTGANPAQISLDEYGGQSDVTIEFRFVSDESGNSGYGAFVDDIELTCDIDDNQEPNIFSVDISYDFNSQPQEVVFSVRYTDEDPPSYIALTLEDTSVGFSSERSMHYAGNSGDTLNNGTYEVAVPLSELEGKPNLKYHKGVEKYPNLTQ